jgi:hypothetical protein
MLFSLFAEYTLQAALSLTRASCLFRSLSSRFSLVERSTSSFPIDHDRPRTDSVEQPTGHDLHDIFVGADAQRDDVAHSGQVFDVAVADVRDVAQRIKRAGSSGSDVQRVARLGNGGRHR